MPASPSHVHHLEWPVPGSRVCGPVIWVRGWIVGQSGYDFCDVRARHSDQTHWGVLGLPRTDLAANFNLSRSWLPAGFIIGVPVADGPLDLIVEAQDASGDWHHLTSLQLTVCAGNETDPGTEGRLVSQPGGSCTMRDPHQPMHGHLDILGVNPSILHGRVPVFGWLLHEAQPLVAVVATTDLLVLNHLAHSAADLALAAKVPHLTNARQARFQGAVDLPSAPESTVCLRVYAELADGSTHLCFVQRLIRPPGVIPPVPAPILSSPPPPRSLPALPSCRPRRLLLAIRALEPDDSTWRALDIARHLMARHQWVVRLLTTADGPLHDAFVAAGVPVQIVNLESLSVASTPVAAEQALAVLNNEVWLRHLDAVAVFDPECLWAAELAQRRAIPALLDCSVATPLKLPPGVQQTVFSSAHAANLNPITGAVVIPPWHSAVLPRIESPAIGGRSLFVAPVRGTAMHGAPVLLRAADWLARHHPAVAQSHRIAVTDVRGTAEESRFIQDAILNQPAAIAVESVSLGRATACICPAFDQPPLRPLLDAAAIGVPVIATDLAPIAEVFSGKTCTLVPAGDPLALAQALVDLHANPEAARLQAATAQAGVLDRHAPAKLLPRWQTVLETMVASIRL